MKRYQSHQLYGERLTMLELKCQTLRTRCNTELKEANQAEKVYWKDNVEKKINNPDEVNFNSELLKEVAKALAGSDEVKARIEQIRKAKSREVRVLIPA